MRYSSRFVLITFYQFRASFTDPPGGSRDSLTDQETVRINDLIILRRVKIRYKAIRRNS